VPIFFGSDLSGVDAETAELRAFAEAALEFSEAGECGQADHVVPEADGVVVARQAADDRAEERDAIRRLELDDRAADVPAGQGQGVVGLGPQLGVPASLVESLSQPGG
jgi:hypothetical protein